MVVLLVLECWTKQLYKSSIVLTAPCEISTGSINVIRCADETHVLSNPIRKQISSEIRDVRSYSSGASFI